MKIMFLGNTDFSIYNYRFELVQKLLELGHEVVIVTPYGDLVQKMVESGCRYIEVNVDCHGTNPFVDLKYKRILKKIIMKERPNFVFGYTIKPNIYGAWVCKKMRIPFIANITGLGPSVENKGIIQKITIILYKIAFNNIKMVFCQNASNKNFFVENNIAVDKIDVLPGSGVNLNKFKFCDYPDNSVTKFVFVSRIRKDKGIDQYLEAANYLKKKHGENVEFHVCGMCDKEYEWIKNDENIIYHGMVKDMNLILPNMHCLVFPSYYAEGLANVLLEASAVGRPIITTDRPGCGEVLEDGVNGYLIAEKNTPDLIDKIERYMALSYQEQKNMGIAARNKVEKEFDRNIIIEKYLKIIHK